jgi:putative spermidine/putrescine transport system ATP-binding protein
MNHGRLEQLGTPEDLYERPATEFVASFVGRTNRLRGFARGDTVEAGGLSLRTCGTYHGDVVVMMRPHRIMLGEGGSVSAGNEPINRMTGRVVRTVYAGDMVQCDVQVTGSVISVEQSNRGAGELPAVGADVKLSFLARDTLVYPATP